MHRKAKAALAIEGSQLFLRVGNDYYRLTGGLTDAELTRESKRLARVLKLPVERSRRFG